MHQFIVSARIRELRDTYPNGKHLLDMASQLSQSDLEALARLWLSEGIPFAFKEVPALYEAIRAWLGAQLNVHPKGDHPHRQWPAGKFARTSTRRYRERVWGHSDLDWTVVSEELFGACRIDFSAWSEAFHNNTVHPRNAKEAEYWDDNMRRVPTNVSNGFIVRAYTRDQKNAGSAGFYEVACPRVQGLVLFRATDAF